MPEIPPLNDASDNGSVAGETPTEKRLIVPLIGDDPGEKTQPAPAVRSANLAQIASGALTPVSVSNPDQDNGEKTPGVSETPDTLGADSEMLKEEIMAAENTAEEDTVKDAGSEKEYDTAQNIAPDTDTETPSAEVTSPSRKRPKINWGRVQDKKTPRLAESGPNSSDTSNSTNEAGNQQSDIAPVAIKQPPEEESNDHIPDQPTEPLPTPPDESLQKEIDRLLPSPDADGYIHIRPADIVEKLYEHSRDPQISDEDYEEAASALRVIFRVTIPRYFGYEDAGSIPPAMKEEFDRFINEVIRYQLIPDEKKFSNEYRGMALGIAAGDNVARQEALAQQDFDTTLTDAKAFARLVETYGRRIPFLLKYPTSDFIANYRAIVGQEYLLEQDDDGHFYFEGVAPYDNRQLADVPEVALPYEVAGNIPDEERQQLEKLMVDRLGDMSHAKMQTLLAVAQAGFPGIQEAVHQSVNNLAQEQLAAKVAKLGEKIDSMPEPDVLMPVFNRIYAVGNTVLPELFGFRTTTEMSPQEWQAYVRLSKRLIFGFGEKGSMQEALIADALHKLPPLERGWLKRLQHRHLDTSGQVNLLADKMRAAFDRDHYFTVTAEGVQHSFFAPLTRPNPAETMEISLPRVEDISGLGGISTAVMDELLQNVEFNSPSTQDHQLSENIYGSFQDVEREAVEGILYLPRYTIDHLPAANETADSENAKLAHEAKITAEGDLAWLEGILHTLYEHPQERAKGQILDKVSLTKPGTFYDEEGQRVQDFAPRRLADIIYGGNSFNRREVLRRFIVMDQTHQENGKVVVLVPRTFAGKPTYSKTGELVYENVARLQKSFPSWFVEFAVVDGSTVPLQKILETQMNASDDARVIEYYAQQQKDASTSISPEADTEQVPIVQAQPIKQVYAARAPYYQSLLLAGKNRVGIVGNRMEVARDGKKVFSSGPIQAAARVFSGGSALVSLPKIRTPRALMRYLNQADAAIDNKWSKARQGQKELDLNRPDHTVAYITEGEHKFAVIERTGTALPYVLRNGEVIPLMRNVWVEALLTEKKITSSEADELSEAMASMLARRDLEAVMVEKALQHLDREIAALREIDPEDKRLKKLQERRVTISGFTAEIQTFGRGDTRFEHTYLQGPVSVPRSSESKEQRNTRKELQDAANKRKQLVIDSLPAYMRRYLEAYAGTFVHTVAQHPRVKTQGVFPVATGEWLIISDAPPQIIARAVAKTRNVRLLPQAIIKEHQIIFGGTAKPIGAAVLKVT